MTADHVELHFRHAARPSAIGRARHDVEDALSSARRRAPRRRRPHAARLRARDQRGAPRARRRVRGPARRPARAAAARGARRGRRVRPAGRPARRTAPAATGSSSSTSSPTAGASSATSGVSGSSSTAGGSEPLERSRLETSKSGGRWTPERTGAASWRDVLLDAPTIESPRDGTREVTIRHRCGADAGRSDAGAVRGRSPGDDETSPSRPWCSVTVHPPSDVR